MKVDYWMQYYDVITNPRWRTAANMLITSASLSENDPIMTPICCQFGCTGPGSDSDKNDLTKIQIFKFKMADGRLIEKTSFSATNRQQIVRYLRNFVWRCENNDGRMWKFSEFGIQDVGRPPSWKSLYRHISVKYHQNLGEIILTL